LELRVEAINSNFANVLKLW